MDDADRAQERIDQELEARIRAARGIPGSDRTMAPGANECVECGELIPSARQIAVPGCQLCIECAERVERAARGLG